MADSTRLRSIESQIQRLQQLPENFQDFMAETRQKKDKLQQSIDELKQSSEEARQVTKQEFANLMEFMRSFLPKETIPSPLPPSDAWGKGLLGSEGDPLPDYQRRETSVPNIGNSASSSQELSRPQGSGNHSGSLGNELSGFLMQKSRISCEELRMAACDRFGARQDSEVVKEPVSYTENLDSNLEIQEPDAIEERSTSDSLIVGGDPSVKSGAKVNPESDFSQPGTGIANSGNQPFQTVMEKLNREFGDMCNSWELSLGSAHTNSKLEGNFNLKDDQGRDRQRVLRSLPSESHCRPITNKSFMTEIDFDRGNPNCLNKIENLRSRSRLFEKHQMVDFDSTGINFLIIPFAHQVFDGMPTRGLHVNGHTAQMGIACLLRGNPDLIFDPGGTYKDFVDFLRMCGVSFMDITNSFIFDPGDFTDLGIAQGTGFEFQDIVMIEDALASDKIDSKQVCRAFSWETDNMVVGEMFGSVIVGDMQDMMFAFDPGIYETPNCKYYGHFNGLEGHFECHVDRCDGFNEQTVKPTGSTSLFVFDPGGRDYSCWFFRILCLLSNLLSVMLMMQHEEGTRYGAIERLTVLALRVAMDSEWVVLLVGTNQSNVLIDFGEQVHKLLMQFENPLHCFYYSVAEFYFFGLLGNYKVQLPFHFIRLPLANFIELLLFAVVSACSWIH